MGETRRLGARGPPSTHATSSSVREDSRARSAARWPAASRARSRRDRSGRLLVVTGHPLGLSEVVDQSGDPTDGQGQQLVQCRVCGRRH